jgi:hypothetical protein
VGEAGFINHGPIIAREIKANLCFGAFDGQPGFDVCNGEAYGVVVFMTGLDG